MTKYHEVTTTGPVEWSRVFEFNRDKDGYQDMYKECEGAYTITQVLDKANRDKLRKAGSQKKPNQRRLEETGEIAIKFERKHLVKNKSTGEILAKAGGAPIVLRPDGQPWSSDEDGLIGNGTIAEVTNLIQTFDVTNKDTGKKEKASRSTLTKVKVLELVSYERQGQEENN